jgi:hypothetical protein
VFSFRKCLYTAAIAGAAAAFSVSTAQGQGTATICKDGTTSVSAGRGACSGHGGVNKAATAKEKKGVGKQARAAKSTAKGTGSPIPTPGTAVTPSRRPSSRSGTAGSGASEDNDPADAVAKCKDGLYSHAKHRRGACSRHGGVASWM